MRALADLDHVNWAGLEHAYGDASDVPDMLRGLSEDEESFGELLGALSHQGRRFSASAAAVPYVAGLAAKPELTTSALMSLGYLAIGDDDVHTFPRSFEAQGIGDPESIAAYHAVQAELPDLVALVAHDDPLTAAAAVWLVSWFPALATRTLPAVRAAAPSITTTLARGLLGDGGVTRQASGDGGITRQASGSGWPEAVAAMCAGPSEWALDEVIAHARRMREPELSGAFTPYLSGDVAYILTATLRLAPEPRRAEAVAAMRILADRVKGARAEVIRASAG